MNILIDGTEYNKETFGRSFDFLLGQGLIEVMDYLKSYKANFVGEVITPYNHIVSLPKNFNDLKERNVKLVLDILKEFKNLKKDGKLLLKNKSYVSGEEHDSRLFYWKKLYSFFIDYVTYGFYYPKKRIISHSIKKQRGVVIPLLTELNRNRIGLGLTYETKNISGASDFRNIYYSTLKTLEEEFATDIEKGKIKEMETLLRTNGYNFERVKIEAGDTIIELKKEQCNIIHEPIAKTLIKFYQDSKIKEHYTINLFYTKEFEYVCEYFIQIAMGHSKEHKPIEWIDPEFKNLNPDIFTPDFIGDVKYYVISQLSARSFEKELYAHNVAANCSLPSIILIPDEETKVIDFQKHGQYKLLIISVSLNDIFKDYLKKTKFILTAIVDILKYNWN